ncbi:MAG: ribose-5-phosphate isomerase [Chthoniobacterales bacterium]|jgi:ribose 5-phosphate isomerase B|nr:ribose-5-phosphate isomerase [Chthoniobacterales bacterium]
MKISLGSDHAGFEYKQALAEMLRTQGHDIIDCGTHSADSTDYPLWCIPAAERVASGEAEKGIVVGGSGNGEAIAANKVKGIRCAIAWSDETAKLASQHNNANVLSIGERMVSLETAKRLVDLWLSTPFEGGRHLKRIEELAKYEAGLPMQ